MKYYCLPGVKIIPGSAFTHLQHWQISVFCRASGQPGWPYNDGSKQKRQLQHLWALQLCSSWDWWSLNQGQGCWVPLTIYRPSTKSQGHHWGCFQNATAVIGCVTVFRVLSPQVGSSHIQCSPRTTLVLAYIHVETGPKSLCTWFIVLVFALHLC